MMQSIVRANTLGSWPGRISHASSSGGCRWLAALSQHLMQFPQFGRFAKHEIYVCWNVPLGRQTLAPAGQQYHRRPGRYALDRRSHPAAIDMGHAKVGHHHGKRLVVVLGGPEKIDA